ncbi:MAG TPA: hypothetical protein VK464_29150 [Symbiobacteriaceae bacterium]|jgi:phosphatidylserine/phosphatidylglycerophosphate/cardiolipin synthase-like enzyme|nr:hypothetical protein [Symbiobacteriaceae bacterium]
MGKTGSPPDPTAGNRGWGVAIEDQALTAYMSRVFEADWSTAYGDVFPFQEGTPFGGPPAGYVPDREIPHGTYAHPFPPLTIREPVAVTPVLAPDHSLLESRGIIGLIRSARESLLIEQQYVQVYCGKYPT